MEINHHLVHAHHNGLIVGTMIGALGVSVVAAIVVVLIKPNIISHPTSFTSVIGEQSSSSTSTNSQSAGIAAQNSMNNVSTAHIGPAARLEE